MKVSRDQLYDNLCQNLQDFKSEVGHPYHKLMDYMLSIYGIDKNYIEIACGELPCVAAYVSDMTGKKVMAVDPNLMITDYPGVEGYKTRFDESFDIKTSDVIYSIGPVEAGLAIAKTANKLQKSAFIMLGQTYFYYGNVNSLSVSLSREFERSLPEDFIYNREKVPFGKEMFGELFFTSPKKIKL